MVHIVDGDGRGASSPGAWPVLSSWLGGGAARPPLRTWRRRPARAELVTGTP